jgi:adenylyltransferase/sulfurtransferase
LAQKTVDQAERVSYDEFMFFNMFQSDPALNLSPQDVKAKLDQGEKIIFLDVREPWEVAINRLDGAVHIPLGELGRRYQELNPDDEIIAYCHMGVRSLKATRFLKEQQFKNVKNLAGGIEAWSLQVDPKVPRYR